MKTARRLDSTQLLVAGILAVIESVALELPTACE